MMVQTIPSPIPIEAIRTGDRLRLTRLLTAVENESPSGQKALEEIFPYTGNAVTIGVTGAPGAGKSSFVNRFVESLRERFPEKKVAILAVDPTSPFSGGAILGDRVRMRTLSGDENVFIRSMATRGALGGLAWNTDALVQVFDAAGFDFVVIETVGAGQSEVDVCRIADVTLVLEVPGLGDDIQAIKAGILESADILIVNKSDLRGAESTAQTLKSMLHLSAPKLEDWEPPVVLTNSIDGSGIDNLLDRMFEFLAFAKKVGEMKARSEARIARQLHGLLAEGFFEQWMANLGEGQFEAMVQRIDTKDTNLYQIVKEVLHRD